ncbi:hypothetical protein [Aquimarina sp. 2201CG14-23]|uniref:hypothetical protein n=1 Tax=Aquimarina mycalae TaxID=3040073 RepID=UPI0024782683|nr:hypothetical protein [Aquimarina sp. 2201CG14-23]MDH7445124.1 hypothetical protein [Aquimarina sp. 2201CG14-23]
MKKFNPLILILILAITSCSEDNSTNNITTKDVNSFVFTKFNVSTSPNTKIDSTYYQITSDKIDYYEGFNFITNQTTSGNYSYENDKISQIKRYSQSNLVHTSTFKYDNSDKLIELLQESTQGESVYNKHTFTYTGDSIFVNWKRSFNGVDFTIDVAHSKIVLDTNNNRTYFENFDFSNQTTKAVRTTYDANNNPIKEEFMYDSGAGLEIEFTNNIVFENSINTLYQIHSMTFSKHTLMLLYHLNSNAVNNFNFKSISPNNSKTFESDFGNIFTYSINNVINEEKYSTLSEFKTFVNSDLFSAFSYEFFE